MDFQNGTCTACNHSVRVPAGSTARARCPKCGGVVELASARSSARSTAGKPHRIPGSGGRSGAGAAGRATHARRAGAASKSSMPLVLGIAGAVVVSIAVWFFAFRGAKETTAVAAAEIAPAIDLSQLADLSPAEGTSEEEWATMNELVTRYRTPPFGPASVQAGDRLMNKGRRSVPAILNGLKRVDLATPEGSEIGWKMQTLLLQGLCGGTNFGWRRETRPEDVRANAEVIQRWFQAWQVAQMDDAVWEQIAATKTIPETAPPPGAGEGTAPAEGAEK